MSNWSKSVIHGGIYTKAQSQTDCSGNSQKVPQRCQKIISQLENTLEAAKKSWERSRNLFLSIKDNLKSHLTEKQEVYWPIFIAITLLLFVFASRIAFAENGGAPNNLPIKDNSKLNLINFGKIDESAKICLASAKDNQNDANQPALEDETKNNETEKLKNDITEIVKNTPMAAMIDYISEKDRIVAAFIVGIAMKESKFGVYAPHIGGRDCYNYWGLKAGGKTVSGGYTCFASPEDAVSTVGKTIEKMVAKGVHTPAQAIGWKCGSSCAGHGAENVHKWIIDVGINFYKINP